MSTCNPPYNEALAARVGDLEKAVQSKADESALETLGGRLGQAELDIKALETRPLGADNSKELEALKGAVVRRCGLTSA